MLKPWKRNPNNASTISSTETSSSNSSSILTSLFSELDGNLIQQINSQLKPKALESGEVLFFADSPVDALFFVTKGSLTSEQDRQVFSVGDWITDVAFYSGDTHQLTIQANEPTALLSLSLTKYDLLPSELQLYLKKGLFKQLKKRYESSFRSTQQISQQNSQLKEALFRANTQHQGEFVSSATAQQVLAKVPRLPVSSMQLLTKLLDPNSSHNEVVELIRQDPSLTSTLLKSINSASYGLENKISDIQHAISLLGIDSVYQIVVSESMRSSLPDTEFFRTNHNLSLEISHLAFVIAQVSQQGKSAELATLGLMSQIGEVVVELLKNQSPKLASLFGQVDAASMGSALLKSWSLPSSIHEPLAYKGYPTFADPDRLPEPVRKSVAILYIASIVRSILHKEDISAKSLYLNEYLQLLNLNSQPLEDTLKEKIIPALRRRKLGLPLSLRGLIE